jgi:GAF domain-containing protein
MAVRLAFADEVEGSADRVRASETWIGEMLAGASSAEGAAAAIGRTLLLVTGAPRAAVFFRSPSGAVTCPWSHNLSDAYVRELVTPAGVNPWAHLLRYPELECMDLPKRGWSQSPEGRHLEHVGDMPYGTAVRERIAREGMRSISTWPLLHGRRVIGAISCYYDGPRVWSAEDEDVMRVFAVKAAAAVPAWTSPRVRETPRDACERLAALERELTAKQARIAQQRASLETEYQRLAAEAARISAEREALEYQQSGLKQA